jgi:tripartite-type tricarboxylate transporter receptor subunit TctC
MNFRRRQFLHATAGAVVLAFARRAGAQAYPSRPVRIFVGFAAGSAGDILSRLIGQRLSDRLGQPFIIENRGGAGGTVAAEALVRAPADGYTLLSLSSADAVNATMYEHLSYNFIRDIAPVASVGRGPLVLVVQPSFPAKTVPEFIAYAKSNPGTVTFASAGVGTVAHMAGELFMAMAGIKMVHVPYRGLAPALTDLLGGQVQAIFSTTPPAIGHIKAGRLRALGVTSATRSALLPELSPIADVLPGYEASLLQGLGAPKNTPTDVVDRLNREINTALADPGMQARLAELGDDPAPMTAAAFGMLLADETEKWAKVVKAAGIKPE